jgi:hypothetical protein
VLATLKARTAMDRAPHAWGDTHGQQRSPLLLFCAGSMLLHALVLAVDAPSGTGMAGRAGGVPSVLHAVLSPLHAASDWAIPNPGTEFVADTAPAPAAPAASQNTSRNGEGPAAASGLTAGAFPLPERWLAAEELSVRAEPLTDVRIEYPPSLPDAACWAA